jgi:hypothetical protein
VLGDFVALDVVVLKVMMPVFGFLRVIIILWFLTAFGCRRIASSDGGGLSTRKRAVEVKMLK